jgi:hypothetical protein
VIAKDLAAANVVFVGSIMNAQCLAPVTGKVVDPITRQAHLSAASQLREASALLLIEKIAPSSR